MCGTWTKRRNEENAKHCQENKQGSKLYSVYIIPPKINHDMFLFVFRSIMFTEATGECRLAAMDRHSLAGRPGFGPAPGVQYMEVNCVSDPSKWVRKIYIIRGDLFATYFI